MAYNGKLALLALRHQRNVKIISQHENPDESRMQKRSKMGVKLIRRILSGTICSKVIIPKGLERWSKAKGQRIGSIDWVQKAPKDLNGAEKGLKRSLKGYPSVISHDENTEFNHFNSKNRIIIPNNRIKTDYNNHRHFELSHYS